MFSALSCALVGSVLAGCAQPAATPSARSAPVGVEQAFEQRAAQVAQAWRDTGIGEAWRSGFVPVEDLTIVPQRGFPDGDTKVAFISGWFRWKAKLPDLAGRGTVTFPDGSKLAVPVVGVVTAYRALAHGGDCTATAKPTTVPTAEPAKQATEPAPSGSQGSVAAVGGDPTPCSWLTVTSATLGTARIHTSRGLATVPAWSFEIAEMPDPLLRVAVAPDAVVPLPQVAAVPLKPTVGLVGSQGITRVGPRSIDYTLGVGSCDRDVRPLVWESADLVVVGGSVTPPTGGSCDLMLRAAPVTADLGAPLGERLVLDAASGQPLLIEAR